MDTQSAHKLHKLINMWSAAEVLLKNIVGLNEEEMYNLASIGHHFYLQGKYAQARIVFEGLVALDPHNAYYFRALGFIYWNQKEFDKALRQFDYAILAAPSGLLNYLGRAEIRVGMQKFAEAKSDLQHVLKLAGTHQTSLRKKAAAMLSML